MSWQPSGPPDHSRIPPPGGPPGRPQGGRSRKSGCGALAVVAVVALILVAALSTFGGSRGNCGDYSLSNGTYTHTPDRGEYDKVGDSYQFVGCDSRSGGFWFFGTGGSGDRYGSGSSNRGGGSGFGK